LAAQRAAPYGGEHAARTVRLRKAESDYRMKFQLFVCGRTFDVDAFLAATGLHCDRVFRRGEKYGYRGDWTEESSGFNLYLGDESKLDLEQQVEVALRFLDENREALSRVSTWPGLESATLAFSPEVEVETSMVSTKVYRFPVSLVRSCAALRLELGFAVRLKWPEELQ
jgi:hypothetical protein